MTAHITGIGSLPHDDPAAAAEFVLRTTTVPYLPQLPARHPEEGMLRQWGDGMCGCGAVDDGYGLRFGAPVGPAGEAFVGAAAVLDVAGGPIIKTQATGPVTLSAALLAGGHPRGTVLECVVAELTGRVGAHISWIEEMHPGTEVVVVIDEPALAAAAGPESIGFPIGAAESADALRALMAAVDHPLGIHCCGETDWALVASLDPAWISWDVMTLSGGLAGHADGIARAVADGTGIMWGLVPVSPGPPGSAVTRIHGGAVAELVVAGAPIEALIGNAWYTPACGLAGVSLDQADWIMDELHHLVGDFDAQF